MRGRLWESVLSPPFSYFVRLAEQCAISEEYYLGGSLNSHISQTTEDFPRSHKAFRGQLAVVILIVRRVCTVVQGSRSRGDSLGAGSRFRSVRPSGLTLILIRRVVAHRGDVARLPAAHRFDARERRKTWVGTRVGLLRGVHRGRVRRTHVARAHGPVPRRAHRRGLVRHLLVASHHGGDVARAGRGL